MTENDRYTRHARLVSQMADRVGLDLIEKMQEGVVDSEGLRQMVHRCENCSNPEDCTQLLASQQGGSNVPSYCQNADRFAEFK